MDIPVRIEVIEGAQLVLEWEDGATSTLSARQLRDACSCAGCRSEAERARSKLRLVAPMLVTIDDAHLVGSYGLNLTFSPDQHRTGIFTFEQLRELADTSGTNT